MKTILLTYELGAGLNHLTQIIEIARALKKTHHLVFALRNKAEIEQAEKSLKIDIHHVQSARWKPTVDKEALKATSYILADTLQLVGFADQQRLAAAVEHWKQVVDEVRPHLIVSDFAPSLRLATRRRVPMVVVGNGYTIPPKGRVLPSMRPWDANVKPMSRAAEAEILLTANRVGAEIGEISIDYVADLFNGDDNILCTLPMFDPYKSVRLIESLWPINIPKYYLKSGTGLTNIPEIFVYLHAGHPGLRALIRALNTIKVPTGLYVTGIDPVKLAAACGKHMGIYKKPVDFSRHLPALRLLVHHGGLGTCHAALAAEIPQLILPDRLERFLNAHALCSAQVARSLSVKQMAEPDRVVEAIRNALEIPAGLDGKDFDRRALDTAMRRDTLRIVTDRIETLIKTA